MSAFAGTDPDTVLRAQQLETLRAVIATLSNSGATRFSRRRLGRVGTNAGRDPIDATGNVVPRSIPMKTSIEDKVEGALHEVKGKVKEVAGKVTDNPKLEAEGTVEKLAGKVQTKVGEVKTVIGK